MSRSSTLWGLSRVLALAVMGAACAHEVVVPVAPVGSRDVVVVEDTAANARAPKAPTFGPVALWSTSFCVLAEVCLFGDVNGDGMADGVSFDHGNTGTLAVNVALSNGNALGPVSRWGVVFCPSNAICAVGDVNGDGKADAVSFNQSFTSNTVRVQLSDGTKFIDTGLWNDFFCLTGEECRVADVNRDGKADIVSFARGADGTNAVYVGLSNGAGFGPRTMWSASFCTKRGTFTSETCGVADVNGDGRADAVAFFQDPNEGVWVSLSTGTSFGPAQQWSASFCTKLMVCALGDVNGDRSADAIAFGHGEGGTGAVFVALSAGSVFRLGTQANASFCVFPQSCAVAPVTADRRADAIVLTHGTNPTTSVAPSM
jgi:hypothetical protein